MSGDLIIDSFRDGRATCSDGNVNPDGPDRLSASIERQFSWAQEWRLEDRPVAPDYPIGADNVPH